MLNFFKSSERNQYLSVCLANLISFSHGNVFAWLSPALLILKSDQTPLRDGPLKPEQASLLGSILILGGCIGNISSRKVLNIYGMRVTLIVSAIPHLIWWLLVFFSDQFWELVVGRCIVGISAGFVFTIIPIFVFQITEKRVCTQAGLFFTLQYNFGILLAFVLGSFVPYSFIPISLVLPLSCIFLVYFFIPETPTFLLKQGKEEEALASLLHYRTQSNEKPPPDWILKEFNELKRLNDENDTKKGSWSALFKKEARHGFIMSAFMYISVNICGFYVLQTYTSSIFKESGSSLLPNHSSMIVAVIQIIANLTSVLVINKFGSKFLLLSSYFGSGVFYAALASYSYLKASGMDVESLNWLPIVSISLTLFSMSIGLTNVTPAVIVQILQPEVVTNSLTLIVFLSLISGFFVLYVFPLSIAYLQLYTTMWILGAICLFCFLVIAIFLPKIEKKKS